MDNENDKLLEPFVGEEQTLGTRILGQEEAQDLGTSFWDTAGAAFKNQFSEMREIRAANRAQTERRDAEFWESLNQQPTKPMETPETLNQKYGTDIFKTSLSSDTAEFIYRNKIFSDNQKRMVENYKGNKIAGISGPALLGDLGAQILPHNAMMNIIGPEHIPLKIAKYGKVFLANLIGNVGTETALYNASEETGTPRTLENIAIQGAVGAVLGTALHRGLESIIDLKKTPTKEIKKIVNSEGGEIKNLDFVKDDTVLNNVVDTAATLANRDRSVSFDRLIDVNAPKDIVPIDDNSGGSLDMWKDTPYKYVVVGEEVLDTSVKSSAKEAMGISLTARDSMVAVIDPHIWSEINLSNADKIDGAILVKSGKDVLFHDKPEGLSGKFEFVALSEEDALQIKENLPEDFVNGDPLPPELAAYREGILISNLYPTDYKPIFDSSSAQKIVDLDDPKNSIGFDEVEYKAFAEKAEEIHVEPTRLDTQNEMTEHIAKIEEQVISGYAPKELARELQLVKDDVRLETVYEKVYKAFTYCLNKGGVL